jgi:hypothetical protein
VDHGHAERPGRGFLFVRKYDSTGVVVGTWQFGTAQEDYPSSVGADAANNFYVAGSTTGNLAAGAGFSVTGYYDAFVRKYSSSNTTLWTRQFGTAGNELAYGVAAGTSTIFVTGSTDGPLAGWSRGSTDAYLRSMDAAAGSFFWIDQ